MAATSVTILTEMANVMHWSEKKRDQYIHALDYAGGMDELNPQEWGQIRRLIFEGEGDKLIRDTVLVTLHDQIEEWIELGYPGTHREWVEAKYEDPKEDENADMAS